MENTNAFGDDDDGDEDNDAESEQEEELQPRVNINAKDKSSYTALHHAAKRGHLVRSFDLNSLYSFKYFYTPTKCFESASTKTIFFLFRRV